MRQYLLGVLAILLALVLWGCNSFVAVPLGDGGSNGAAAVVARVFGQALARPFIAVEPNFRADVIANRALIEAEGLEVSADGSIILFPASPAGCYRVQTDTEQVVTSFDGSFSLAEPGGANGKILHPTDGRAPAEFDATVLSSDPEQPTVIQVLHPFKGPCGMNIPLEDFCTVDRPNDLPAPILARAVPTAITNGPRGTYPVPIKNTVCEDKNGILSGVTRNKFLAYVGSTCDGYVKVGCCPNENPFSDVEYNILSSSPGFALIEAIRAGNLNVQLSPAVIPAGLAGAPDLSCVDNHKGRVCQQLLPGDISIDTGKNIATAFEVEVVEVLAGSNYSFAVHNNGCFGTTEITPLVQFINGTLTGIGLRAGGAALPVTPALVNFVASNPSLATAVPNFPASGLLKVGQKLDHFNPTTPLPTYVPDRFLNFAVPTTAQPGQVDVFLMVTDHSPVVIIFRVVGSGGDGTGIQPPNIATLVTPSEVSFTHCVGVTPCPQTLTQTVTVTNNGGSEIEVVPQFEANSALSTTPVRKKLLPGEMQVFTLEFDCTRTESYTTNVTFLSTDLFGQTSSKTTRVVATIEHEVLVLDFPIGPFPAGTEIRMSRVAGGTRAGVGHPGCPEDHLHGAPVSIDGIHVKNEDPNPSGCGHGPIRKSEGGAGP